LIAHKNRIDLDNIELIARKNRIDLDNIELIANKNQVDPISRKIELIACK